MSKIGKAIGKVFKGIKKVFKKVIDGIGKVMGKLGPIGSIALGFVLGPVVGTLAKANGLTGQIFSGIQAVQKAISLPFEAVKQVGGTILGDALGTLGKTVGADNFIGEGLMSLSEKILTGINNVGVDGVSGGLQGAMDNIGAAWDGVTESFNQTLGHTGSTSLSVEDTLGLHPDTISAVETPIESIGLEGMDKSLAIDSLDPTPMPNVYGAEGYMGAELAGPPALEQLSGQSLLEASQDPYGNVFNTDYGTTETLGNVYGTPVEINKGDYQFNLPEEESSLWDKGKEALGDMTKSLLTPSQGTGFDMDMPMMQAGEFSVDPVQAAGGPGQGQMGMGSDYIILNDQGNLQIADRGIIGMATGQELQSLLARQMGYA